MTQRTGRRSSAAVEFLRPAHAASNLTVRTRALATRILIERDRAVGVEYVEGMARTRPRAPRRRSWSPRERSARPSCLLLGIGPADELRARHRGRARPARRRAQPPDHIDVYVISEFSGRYSYNKHTQLHRQLWAGIQYYACFRLRAGDLDLAEAGGFWYADPSARSPDIQFHFPPASGSRPA